MNIALFYQAKKTIEPKASYEVAVAENPRNRRVSEPGRKKRAVNRHTHFWAPGRSLRIAFLNGDQDFKDAVKAAANNWLPHINLTFDFIEGNEGDIRIQSEAGIYWSYIGTDALLDTDDPTMYLSPDQHMPEFFAANVMHEFGHALGAEHEHLHPEASIPWNKEAVYASWGVNADADENDPKRQAVDERYFNLLDASEVNHSTYDPLSIMHYEVRQHWTHGDVKIDLNLTLSEKDKAFMEKAYPYSTAENE
ncbi:hypothetical protein KJF94_02535 [Pseudomonas hormoni]|uniref:Peptidase M12 n=1 Tax=Pseudomonas hormoni TaxID=3093767 RepID=A0ABX8EXJ5_9PSED|nr:hypothetical protein [Pseudomonas hormoni]QVW24479.1 hypothetical protein KJF94_02535 [Pseudomonas hormoni]